MSKLTPFQQALATNMGQEKLDSDNLVTLVRRRFLLEEVVLTREQYENYSSKVDSTGFTNIEKLGFISFKMGKCSMGRL